MHNLSIVVISRFTSIALICTMHAKYQQRGSFPAEFLDTKKDVAILDHS